MIWPNHMLTMTCSVKALLFCDVVWRQQHVLFVIFQDVPCALLTRFCLVFRSDKCRLCFWSILNCSAMFLSQKKMYRSRTKNLLLYFLDIWPISKVNAFMWFVMMHSGSKKFFKNFLWATCACVLTAFSHLVCLFWTRVHIWITSTWIFHSSVLHHVHVLLVCDLVESNSYLGTSTKKNTIFLFNFI